ncbi:MAG: phosphoribosylaminoimidazolesuccinocarboxamide synthase [Syntrophomonadaceae bacterium]|nr:phosphoribosylaminoimidazolesuccinocarboxamide synthase [Syntrophomonadaceae bacterium]
MEKIALIYEGKAKKVFQTADPELVLVEFKNDATAFNGLKKGQIAGKGSCNNQISSILFQLLEENGIKTHFVKQVSETEMLVQKLNIILVEVVVRNLAAGSLVKRIGLVEGQELKPPVLEFYYKNDALGDPLINNDHVFALGLANPEQLAQISSLARQVNGVLQGFFLERDLLLVDFKLEFGMAGQELLLGDEISPDTCRLWDRATRKKLDKDRFRQDLGEVSEAYQEVLRRLTD